MRIWVNRVWPFQWKPWKERFYIAPFVDSENKKVWPEEKCIRIGWGWWCVAVSWVSDEMEFFTNVSSRPRGKSLKEVTKEE